ncbi:hypothetical protein LNT08_16285, partial [Klebsiella pneumoniae]|nr:hypothetical protein [Klebsiella pneumoniae]MCJ5144089.1 hypothetical protein [Klebsiella pneumoniae]
KIGPDPRNFNQRVSLGRNDLLIRTFLKPLMKPGLGVEIDEARVIELSKNAPDWRNPLWRYEDGSVAEW